MNDSHLFKPIRNFSLLILAVGAFGLLNFFLYDSGLDIPSIFKVLIVAISFFHLFIGFNIITRNKLGFGSLKLYLYLMYPGFPLGYYYAKRTFEYIKSNNIERFFDKSVKI